MLRVCLTVCSLSGSAVSSSRLKALLRGCRSSRALCAFWHQPLWIQSCRTRVYLLPQILIRANHEGPCAMTSRPMTHPYPVPSHASVQTQPSILNDWRNRCCRMRGQTEKSESGLGQQKLQAIFIVEWFHSGKNLNYSNKFENIYYFLMYYLLLFICYKEYNEIKTNNTFITHIYNTLQH